MKTNTLIIGAGIYGVALANYLFHSNQSFSIVGKYMDLWQNHTFQNMKLRSDFSTSEIAHPENKFSAKAFLKENPEFEIFHKQHLPARVFRQYLTWVKRNLEYPVIDDLVEKLELLTDGRFLAKLKNKRNPIYARNVVLACGHSSHVFIPPEVTVAVKISGRKVLHSYDSTEIEKIKNSTTLVIGSGQSAAETIDVLKQNQNQVIWYARRRPVFLEQPVNIPSWLFRGIIMSAKVFYFFPEIVRHTMLKILSRSTIMPEFKELLEKTVRVKNSAQYDYIIAGTGFHFNLDNLPILSEKIKSLVDVKHGYPVLDRFFQSSLSGLFFMGAMSEFCFGTSQRFIIGSRYSAPTIAKKIGS